MIIIASDTCYSYTMGMSGLPDMYTRSMRAAGPRAEGVHIRQTTKYTWYNNSYAPYSPSPGKLEPAQARKHASLQPHCIYRENFH